MASRPAVSQTWTLTKSISTTHTPRDAEVGGDGRSLDEALGAAEGVDAVNATHTAAVGDGAI